MEPTSTGGVLSDLTRLTKGPAAAARERRQRWTDSIWLYRRAAVELAIIAAVAITVVLYGIAVVWFARWAL